MMPYSMKPTGWFQIGWSGAVGAGEVKPLRFFGEDLVAFRDEHGALSVLDAHCQHLGANLGFGGCVTADGIQCPFHGWVWDAQGANVSIPYQDTPNRARRIRAWTVVEHNGLMLAWHDEDGRPPLWNPPSIFRDHGAPFDDEAGYHDPYPGGAFVFESRAIHPQYVLENAVDPHHFRFVHGTNVSPTVLREEVGDITWKSIVGFGKKWQHTELGDELSGTLTFIFSGPGFSFDGFATPKGNKVICIAQTPIDDQHSDVFSTTWLPRVPEFESAESRGEAYRESADILAADVNIWEHQRYLDPAGLAADEVRGFNHARRWGRRFYPGTDEFAADIGTRV